MIQHFRKHVQHAHPELDKWSKQANGQEEDKEEDEAHDRNRQSWLSQPQTSKKAKMHRLPLLAHRSHRKMLAVKKVRLRVDVHCSFTKNTKKRSILKPQRPFPLQNMCTNNAYKYLYTSKHTAYQVCSVGILLLGLLQHCLTNENISPMNIFFDSGKSPKQSNSA